MGHSRDFYILNYCTQIMEEFSLIMNKTGLFETFESSWPKWESTVLSYVTSTKSKTQGLRLALKGLQSPNSDSEDDEEHHSTTDLDCLM